MSFNSTTVIEVSGQPMLAGNVILAGTTNQVILTQVTNTITFSLPQNINTTAIPTFGGMNLNIQNATDVGLTVKAAAAQSADLIDLQDSGANNLVKVLSTGDITYTASNRTISNGAGLFDSSSNILLNNAASAPTVFRFSGTFNYTTTPTFGIGFSMFAFAGTIKASTNNLQASPYIFFNTGTYTADTVVWTGGDIGGSFVEGPVFNTANGGSFNNWTHTGFRSYCSVSSGNLIKRQSIKILDATGGGTITDQVAIDIDSLTKGSGSNIAIRTGTSGDLLFGNVFGRYNNLITASNGIPSILAAADLVTQGAAIAATTIYTPVTSGFYRISAYLQVTRAATTSSILGGATGLVITYNDGNGNVAQSNTMAFSTTAGAIATTSAGNTTATNLNGQMVIYARTGVAIQYAIGYTSVGGTSMQYAAHIRVETL